MKLVASAAALLLAANLSARAAEEASDIYIVDLPHLARLGRADLAK